MGFQRLLLFKGNTTTEGGGGGGGVVVSSSVDDREADTLKLRITGRDIIIVEKGTIEIWRNTEETRQNAILALTSLPLRVFLGYQRDFYRPFG